MMIIEEIRNEFGRYLDRYLDECRKSAGSGSQISEVMAYALEGPGKKVRPVLTLMSCHCVGGDYTRALPAALAVEMIHTYSLVHDDLPCMDDDDLRRGRPTVHKKYSDALAVLCGDALLTEAFAVVSGVGCSEEQLSSDITVQLVQEIARGAGARGMVEGQMQDLYWTGRAGASQINLDHIHNLKTGALLGTSCALGAIAAGRDRATVESMRKVGLQIGLAFQIIDDLLDDQEGTGKSKGKDATSGKLTYLSHLTRDAAQSKAMELTNSAIHMIETVAAAHGGEDAPLVQLSRDLLERRL